MAPSRKLNERLEPLADKCYLPFLDDSSRRIVFFDVQHAEPGTFTVPGVIDLEVYEPGSLAEFSWIFFKGDPMTGPQPDHPWERPFNDTTKFSIDLVKEDDTSKVIREIMAPTNSSLFYKGGAPFGRNGHHSMYNPRLDSSCKYYFISEMIYRWPVHKNLESDTVFRLRLTTDEPPTTHLSGNFQISNADSTCEPLFGSVGKIQLYNLSEVQSIALGGSGYLLLIILAVIYRRYLLRSKRVMLE